MNSDPSTAAVRIILILLSIVAIIGTNSDILSRKVEAVSGPRSSLHSAPASSEPLAVGGNTGSLFTSHRLASALFSPTITATKSHMPAGNASPGATLTYQIVISNTGNMEATSVNFTDTIDPNTTLVNGSLIVSPIAVNDSYQTIGNVPIQVPAAQGLFANDFNPNGPANQLVVTGNTNPSHGSLSINTMDGSFTYTPNAGDRASSDSFTYTLGNATGKTDTATVTISLSGMIWFVNNSAAVNGDGRLGTPFRDLVGATNSFNTNASDAAGDTIFVYTGNSGTTPYTGGLTLLASQKLIGQGAGATLTSIVGLPAPSGTNLLPITGGTNPVITAGATNLTLGTGNTVRGVTLNVSAAAATALTGSGFGTLSLGETAIGGSAGQALNLNNGTLSGPSSATAAFTSIASTNSSTTGISLTSVSGNLSSGTTTVTNSTGIGISVNTSSAALNLGSTTSTQSGGTGVSLTTNTGTITYSALNITPDATQRGLLATENTNTITATSGIISTSGLPAVEVTRASGTTPLAIALTSISANAGAKGLILTNTSGSFTVNGTGTAGSGGTIQNCSQHGARFNNVTNLTLNWMNFTNNGTANLDAAGTCGDGYNGTNTNCAAGIDFQTVTTVSLSNVHVSGGAQMGINGKNVTDLTLTSVEVDNAGNEVHEDGIQIHNLFGTKTWENLNIHDNAARQLEVQTASGSNNLTIKNSFFTSATFQPATRGAQGILFSGHGNANIKLTVLDSYFKNCFSTAVFSDTADSSVATLIVERATMEDNGGNFVAASAGSGDFTYALRDSTMWNDPAHTNSGALSLFKGAPTTGNFRGEITGNTFGKPDLAMSGGPCSSCVAIAASNAGAISGFHELLIQNNTIQRTGGGGINVTSGSGNSTDGSTMRVKIVNNTLKDPDNPVASGGAQAITVVNGTSAGDTTQTCAEISGNNIQDAAGGGIWQAIATIRIRHVQNNTVFRMPGYTGGATDTTAVANFLNGQNTLPVTYTASATLGSGPGTFGNTSPAGSSCIPMSPMALAEIAPASADATSTSAQMTGNDHHLWVPETAPPRSDDRGIVKLTQAELEWMAQAALDRWRQTGIPAEDLARLQTVRFDVAGLPDRQLTATTSSGVTIDETAAGYGWFFDQTPFDDSEFSVAIPGRELQTTELSPAHGQMDLLTVMMRELGMEYLNGKDRVPKQLRPLLEPRLSPAVRRLLDASRISLLLPEQTSDFVSEQPAVEALTGVVAISSGQEVERSDVAQASQNITVSPQSGEIVSKMLGTIPASKSLTIMYQVTINNPLPVGVCTVTNPAVGSGANITGTGFSPVTIAGDVTTVVTPITLSSCSSNIVTSTAAGACNKVVTYTPPTATAGCPTPTVICVPASGATFNKGVTTVTCTASNAPGSADDVTCSFTVTVNDNEAPTFANCSNIIANTAAGQCQAVVNFTTTLNDNCPGQTFTCTPASGSTFMKGTTTVNCTGQDASGNQASPCSFTVTVNDIQAPSLTCPSNITVSNDSGLCSAVVTYSAPTATDNCPPLSFAATCVPPAGTAFPKGTTTVTCTATDTATSPNSTTCNFQVTVNDTEKPKSCITPPANMISWWPGDNTSNDIQGVTPNNNPGTLVNGTSFAAGKVGHAFQFDGIDDRVDVPNSTSLNITGNQLTLDGWINPTSNVNGTFYFGRSAPSNHPYVLYFNAADGVHIITRAGGNNVEFATNYFPTPGAWTHLALVYNGAAMKLYANGSEVFSGAASGNLDSQNVDFCIGNRTVGAATSFNGMIDEVEVFNRALTATEIQAIYNAASFGKCKPVVVNTAAGQCTATNTYTSLTFSDNCAPAGSIVCTPAANTTFNKGVTTVSCTITDSASPANTFTNSFEVRVIDNQAPVLGLCPTNITVDESAPGSGSATVTYGPPSSSDNCTGQTVTCNPASGSNFAVGITTVSCQATDTSGNTSSPCSFTVQVKPLCSVICPANVTQNVDAGTCSTTVMYSAPTTTGNCGTVTCSPPSNSVFQKGVTTVTCTPAVAAPPCTFTVTVIDNQPPTFPQGCPANQTVNADSGQCTAMVTYSSPLVADNCPGAAVSCSPPSGANFPTGVTTVSCTATDQAAAPNTATCSFMVTVVDNQAPTFPNGCPANQTVNTAAGQCEAMVTYTTPAVADNCPGAAVSCTPASGGAFAKGTTTVTCTATDAATTPNIATCTFTITVIDNQDPVLSACPANQTVNTAPGQCQAVVSFAVPKATDNCAGVGAVTCSPASGASFIKGTTTVTCSVSDAAGRMASCSFTVTVVDNQPPGFPQGCPANQTVSTGGGCATVTYAAPAISDNCPGASVVCSPSSGTCFPIGTTTVTCTATDTASPVNSASCQFTITVVPCVISCPANISKVTDPDQCGAVVQFAPTATPGCGMVSCTPASGTFFPKGTTTVTCSTQAGPSCSFTVTVNDTQPPSLICPPNQTAVTPLPGGLATVVNYLPPAVTDNCIGGTMTCVPPSGSNFGLGVTTINCTATDTAGNIATCSFLVTVFNACLQDDAMAGAVLLWNTQTGDYRFCCNGSVFTGKGSVVKQGNIYLLTHNTTNRRVSATFDGSLNRGTASLQSPPGAMKCMITDRNIGNNSCQCP